jgi:predicted dehydrogenase
LSLVFDPDARRAGDLAGTVEGLVAVGSADLVIHGDIEAVVVAAPTQEHFDLGQSALEAGRHVLMEKPFTRTAHEAERLAEIADVSGVVLMPAQVARFLPAVTAVRERIASTDHGPLLQAVERRFTAATSSFGWRQSLPEFLISHLGSHSMDAFLWLTGEEVADVHCWATSHRPEGGVVDEFTLVATTTTGATISLHQSLSSREEVFDWVFVWQEATAVVEGLLSSRWDGAPLVEAPPTSAMPGGFEAQADEFVRACLGDRSLETTVMSVLPAMRALDLAVIDAGIRMQGKG